MLKFPLEIPLSAVVIEHINVEMAKGHFPGHAFGRNEVAEAIHANSKLVGDVMMEIGGSAWCITVLKEKEAWRA